MTRIYIADLKEIIADLNEISGYDREPKYPTKGSYILDEAYGGFQLQRQSKDTAVNSVWSGYVSKKELYHKIKDFISGMSNERNKEKTIKDILRDIPRVSNMINNRGNTAPNQFLIHTNKGVFFQSYSSIIAFKPYNSNKKTLIDYESWDYSRTTGKYRNIFLRETKAETQKKIDSGVYKLCNLN